jgi:hypothetical protein
VSLVLTTEGFLNISQAVEFRLRYQDVNKNDVVDGIELFMSNGRSYMVDDLQPGFDQLVEIIEEQGYTIGTKRSLAWQPDSLVRRSWHCGLHSWYGGPGMLNRIENLGELGHELRHGVGMILAARSSCIEYCQTIFVVTCSLNSSTAAPFSPISKSCWKNRFFAARAEIRVFAEIASP